MAWDRAFFCVCVCWCAEAQATAKALYMALWGYEASHTSVTSVMQLGSGHNLKSSFSSDLWF